MKIFKLIISTSFRKLGLVIFVIAVALISSEIILRLFYFGPGALLKPDRYEPLDSSSPYFLVLSDNPRIAIELRPRYSWYFLGKARRTNEFGFCDEKHSNEQLLNGTNIIVMGESFAEAAGVRMEDRFSAKLEKKLRESGNFNVINIAVTNTTLESQIELLKTKVIPIYRPKYVLVNFLTNGNMNAKTLSLDIWKERIAQATSLFPLWKRSFALFILNDYSMQVFLKLRVAMNMLSEALFGKHETNVRPKDNLYNGSEENGNEKQSFAMAKSLFQELVLMSKQNGFKVILSPLSHIKNFSDSNSDVYARNALFQIATELEIEYIDTYPFYNGLDERYCVLWSSNRHPNAFAHEVIAEILAKKLLFKGMHPR